MKKTQKIFAVALVMIMLMSAVCFNSFAALDFLKAPEVESVAFTDSQSISLKELQYYYAEAEEIISRYGDENGTFPKYLYFDLSYSSIDYTVEITMSDGSKVAFSLKDFYAELGRVYTLEVFAYVSYEEYLEVSESGADTVDVVFETYVYNNLFGNYTEDEPKVFTLEKNLTDCFVKSISEISGVPSEICEYGNYYDLDGAEFSVEYADGRTEKHTAEVSFGEYFPVYKLGDTELSVYDDEGKLYIQFIDALYEKDIIYVEEPFKSIEITDCIFDAENLSLTSLSYKIEWKNGDIKTYTYTPAPTEELLLYEVIERVDGFNIYLDIMPFEIDYESGDINYDKINITVYVGEEVTDTYSVDSPYAGTLNTLTSVAEFFSKIISFFRNIISYIVNMLSFV